MTKKNTRIIGYVRVSTSQQDVAGQRNSIYEYTSAKNLHVEQFIEVTSSAQKSLKNRKIDQLREAIEDEPATIVFSELSRLGRSVGQITRLVDEFVEDRNCTLIFLKENLTLQRGTKNINSVAILGMFSILAEIERMLISERTKEGLAAARAKKVKLGRPRGVSKLDCRASEILELQRLGVTKIRIAEQVGCTTLTLRKWLKRHKDKK